MVMLAEAHELCTKHQVTLEIKRLARFSNLNSPQFSFTLCGRENTKIYFLNVNIRRLPDDLYRTPFNRRITSAQNCVTFHDRIQAFAERFHVERSANS